MKGFWVRMKGQARWKLLVTTDLKITFLTAMKYYQTRWSIEVFFRDCKQNLGFSHCQSLDFDAQIANISIVFMNYLILALKKRFQDYETLGVLFMHFKEMMLKRTIVQKIWELLVELFESVFMFLGVEWELYIQTLIYKQDEIIKEMEKSLNTLFSLSHKELSL